MLLVEDDADLRSMVAEVLRDAGHTVDEAPDGRAGLAMLEARAGPCLVLLDWRLRDMGGEEFLATLSSGLRGRFPVVLLSGGSIPRAVEDRSGVVGTLRKPVSIETLLRAVEVHAP